MSWWIILIILLAVFAILYFLRACKKANRTDWGGLILNTLEGMNRLFCHRYHRLNKVTIPLNDSGPAIVVSNHISGLDPMLMLASSPRPLRFLIAREQYERFGFKWLFRAIGCIPIDRSKQADNAMRQAIKALHNGEVLAIYPMGKIHLEDDPPVKMKPGAARLAIKSKCKIYPLYISGVKSPGNVMLPVFLRGNARIRLCDSISETESDQKVINELICRCIDG